MNVLDTELNRSDLRQISSMLTYALDELANKKPFDATYRAECDECGDGIEEGDKFSFYGNKQKMCDGCREAMIADIKGLKAKLTLAIAEPER